MSPMKVFHLDIIAHAHFHDGKDPGHNCRVIVCRLDIILYEIVYDWIVSLYMIMPYIYNHYYFRHYYFGALFPFIKLFQSLYYVIINNIKVLPFMYR